VNGSVEVPFVAFVDRSGKVIDARVLPSESGDVPAPLAEIARRALYQWKFKSARTVHGPTADFVFTKVTVRN
jgi:hypothetical protein